MRGVNDYLTLFLLSKQKTVQFGLWLVICFAVKSVNQLPYHCISDYFQISPSFSANKLSGF